MGTILLIASGKGGTGKTALSAGLAASLACLGKRVLAVDLDAGMRNLDLALGMTEDALFSFADVASGLASLEKAAAPSRRIPGLSLLTAPVSCDLSGMSRAGFDRLLCDAAGLFDMVVLDCPAGQGGLIPDAANRAHLAAVVATPDTPSLRGAERMAADLFGLGLENVRLVVNRVRPRLIRRGICKNIDDSMDETGLPLLGIVPEDTAVLATAARGVPVACGDSPAARAYLNIARRVTGQSVPLLRF